MKLIADGLASIRGGRVLFSGLSFEVGPGEALLVTGPNGAGKTTLLRIVAGLLQPAAGSVKLEGADPERSLADDAHFVGHANGVKANLTVEENVTFWCGFLGGTKARAIDALDTFGLAGLRDIPAGYLSAGQRRRLALARLRSVDRAVWLLDEPEMSLDSAAQELLTAAVEAHLTAGGLVMAAMHAPFSVPKARTLRLGNTASSA
jgi:heme exporter protein A